MSTFISVCTFMEQNPLPRHMECSYCAIHTYTYPQGSEGHDDWMRIQTIDEVTMHC